MFCMLLRKHLTGMRIEALNQPPFERLAELVLTGSDELGIPCERRLVLEMMGRNCNLLLLDAEGTILGCLKRTDASADRTVLPGFRYEPPRPIGKPGLFLTPDAEFLQICRGAQPEQETEAFLRTAFSGVSPLLAREIAQTAQGSVDARMNAVSPEELLKTIRHVSGSPAIPVLIRRGGVPFDFYCRKISQYGSLAECETYPDFSALMDGFFTEKEQQQRQKQRGSSLRKLVSGRRERAARKLSARIAEYRSTEQRETWRQYGDLIKANLYRMKRGAGELETENFYDENNAIIRIPLQPKLSPAANAERYYKLYTKAKHAEVILRDQIAEAEREGEYLDSVLEAIDLAEGEKDLAEIRRELTAQGYLKEEKGRVKKQPPRQPLQLNSPSGIPILIGRNNTQNDELTLRRADRQFVWLHAKQTHGSHVIVCSRDPDRETLILAAELAAWYSKARDASNVPVDVAPVRNVRKPSGARPGMVIYTDYRTLYVTPDRERIEAAMQKQSAATGDRK